MEIFCVGSHHTDDINSLFLCIPWWIRITGLLLRQVSPRSRECSSGDQFCTFLSPVWARGGHRGPAGGLDDPGCALLLWAPWRKQIQVQACDEVLISVLTFIFWVFWSSFSCVWTRNKKLSRKKIRRINKWVLKLMQHLSVVCFIIDFYQVLSFTCFLPPH